MTQPLPDGPDGASDQAPQIEPPQIEPPQIEPPQIEPPEDVPAELVERRYPSTIGGAFYIGVLVVAAVAVVIVYGGDWRLGVRLLGGALGVAAALRLVLPRKDAGMLAVRGRILDAVVLGGIGGAMFFLAATIPGQPT